LFPFLRVAKKQLFIATQCMQMRDWKYCSCVCHQVFARQHNDLVNWALVILCVFARLWCIIYLLLGAILIHNAFHRELISNDGTILFAIWAVHKQHCRSWRMANDCNLHHYNAPPISLTRAQTPLGCEIQLTCGAKSSSQILMLIACLIYQSNG